MTMAVEGSCPACHRPRGSNAECYSCRDLAARELAEQARDITDEALRGRVEAARTFLDRPPWYARALVPRRVWARIRLVVMLLEDYVRGRYRKVPWRSIALVAAAMAYVISPFDLLPDLLIPVGMTDDLLVLALAWRAVKRDLREYCAWKGLSPAHFGI
jgi:uncharacterized membrane protein YkvA (DUF1232 family)